MLTKLLEEIAKRFIDVVAKRPYGVTLLVVLAIVGTTFLLLEYFRSTPTAATTLRDPIFLAVAGVAVLAGVAVVLKQSGRVPRVLAISTLLLLLGLFTWGAWYVHRDDTPLLKIDLVFEDDAKLDSALVTEFALSLQQPHIRITLLERQLIPPSLALLLKFDDALAQSATSIRPAGEATHTILVTSKMLANTQHSNLFYSARGNFGVVSLRGVADPTKPQDRQLALRYLASMVPLVAMHALAHDRRIELLPDRSPETEHGCLHDFSTNRLLLIEKLRRGPKLCTAEAQAITRAFGPTIVAEYKEILEAASRPNAP